MAYNPMNYFPATYQPMYQMPQIQQPMQPQGRMVDVVPIDSVESAESFPVPIGATQLMISKDDSFIAVKSNGVNGQSKFDVYDKRPPAPPMPKYNMADYVRRDEIDFYVNDALAKMKKTKTVKEKEDESV